MRDSRLERLTAELEEALAGTEVAAAREPGGRVTYPATVAGTSGADVIVELGPRVQGAVPLAEFSAPPTPGTSLRVTLRGQEDGLWVFSVKEARTLAAWSEMQVGSLVKGKVIGFNKGGLELKVDGIDAFLPASQVALEHVEDLATLAGQTLVCEVLEIDRAKRRVVVSRRAVLEAERERTRREAADELAVGAVVRGRVVRLESYGAFVDVGGGLEGLLHVSNLAHARVERPDELLHVGQELEVQVLSIEEGGKRVGLGRKQLEADPWDAVAYRYEEDQVVTGRVRRLVDFGAFVELEPGVDGLLHVSQLGQGRVRQARDVLKVGDELSVRILSIDSSGRRISLSRLDPRGALIGSEDSVDDAEVRQLLQREEAPSGTNLGALFRKALGERK